MREQHCHARSIPGQLPRATLRQVIAASVAILAFAGTGASVQAADAAAEAAIGDAQRGKELFVNNGCFACHGYNGQGGSYTGPRIAPDPLPWQAIAAFIRFPRGVTPPYTNWPFNVMPPFTAKLVPDKDVQDIYAYLKSIPGPTDIRNIPTFKK